MPDPFESRLDECEAVIAAMNQIVHAEPGMPPHEAMECLERVVADWREDPGNVKRCLDGARAIIDVPSARERAQAAKVVLDARGLGEQLKIRVRDLESLDKQIDDSLKPGGRLREKLIAKGWAPPGGDAQPLRAVK